MGRKPHKVAFLGQRPAPSVVLCVQCCRTQEYAGDADEYGQPAVKAWTVAASFINGSRVNGDTLVSGTTAQAFWDCLASNFKGNSEVLIVSAGAREHAAALGLWDKILDGAYAVFGYDPQAKDGGQGYVILESPPTVIRFVEAKSKRTYTWIDPANFGQRGFVGTADDDDADAGVCKAVAEEVRDWYASYVAMLDVLKLGSPEHTAASQAAQGYRMSYMDHAITVHDNEAVLRLERAALFGGRNECYFVGTVLAERFRHVEDETGEYPNWQAGLFDGPESDPEAETATVKRPVIDDVGPIYQFDFNSLYPAVASSNLMPVKLRGVLHSPAVSTLLAACECMPVIATVRIETAVPCVPVWIDPRMTEPHSLTRPAVKLGIGELRHRMVFPTGEFFAVLCGPEILLAAKCGKLVSCGVAALYDGRPIYRKWVDTLYTARRQWSEGKASVIADCVKAIMNASFAKWAQLKRRWYDEPGELCPWPWDQWWRENEESGELEQWRCFAWTVQRLAVEGEPGDSFPAITAYINSLARVKLWEAMRACDPGRVYYVDTDSVWTDQAGFEQLRAANMLSETELGKLKKAGEYRTLELFGLKRYLADGRLTVAGAHGETVRTSDAWAMALRPMPAHSFLRMHRPPGIDLRTVRFRLNTPYRHGLVEPDGWTRPIAVFDR